MWKVLKEVVSTSREEFSSSMLGDDEFHVAEKLNRFFIDSIDELAGSIPAPLGSFADVHMGGDDCSEVFEDITLNKLSNIITQMKNKSSGDELLSVALLKSLFPVIGYPLLNFVNSCLRTAELPTDLKCSIIIPVPKVNAPKGPVDFRPINLLPVLEKVLEIIVYEHLIKFIEKNDILFPFQSGFRKNHSCESACQLVCTKWKRDIDKGNIILGVFVDLKTAFEIVDRERLLVKCERLGI
ncbi:hypothetical protein HHI36_012707 [Cryptolaemus montrouzieri]|uniref:Reverse transcriptase domain-containing protein n=1 Tax=Cryptolaemus montrouzieri TaxID=559131 RepID=A0ABD2NF86_9CUCU